VKILDVNRSGTIDLAEFETLYPDAAQLFLNRFDFDQSGDLSIQELKALLNSNKLASETLKKLKGMVRPLYNYGGGFYFFH
jgi:Ca2+-binding EF-hand superfamily protein